MNCNMELHKSLIELGDIVCPLCDQNLKDSDKKPRDRSAKYDLCCDCQDIINDNGMIVCRSCGIVSSIGNGGSGAFLRNCAQTEPSPILRFHRVVRQLVCRLVQSRAGE